MSPFTPPDFSRPTRAAAPDARFVYASAVVDAVADGVSRYVTSEVSREKPIDYGQMARLLLDERERGGYVLWVAGPARVHLRARTNMTWFWEILVSSLQDRGTRQAFGAVTNAQDFLHILRLAVEREAQARKRQTPRPTSMGPVNPFPFLPIT